MNSPEAVQMRLEKIKEETISQKERECREFGVIGFYHNKFKRIYRRWKYDHSDMDGVFKRFGTDRVCMQHYCTEPELDEVQSQWEADWAEEEKHTKILRSYVLMKTGLIEVTSVCRIRCMDAMMPEQ